MAIRYTLPNTWRVLEAKHALMAAAKLLEHNSRHGVRSEPLALLRSEVRAFAQDSLVGVPGNVMLDDQGAQALSNLITRTLRLSTSEAARAGVPQPPVALLTRVVSAVNAREQREGLAGPMGAFEIM